MASCNEYCYSKSSAAEAEFRIGLRICAVRTINRMRNGARVRQPTVVGRVRNHSELEQDNMTKPNRIMLSAVLISVLTLGVTTARAEMGVQLARDNQCLACHQVEVKRVGPAFAVVAQRYAQAPEAQSYLTDVIRQGSRAKWGAIPMPAQQQVSPTDASALAAWILSLADDQR